MVLVSGIQFSAQDGRCPYPFYKCLSEASDKTPDSGIRKLQTKNV